MGLDYVRIAQCYCTAKCSVGREGAILQNQVAQLEGPFINVGHDFSSTDNRHSLSGQTTLASVDTVSGLVPLPSATMVADQYATCYSESGAYYKTKGIFFAAFWDQLGRAC